MSAVTGMAARGDLMETKLEQIARAIKAKQFGRDTPLSKDGPWREFELDVARAAVAAMREPMDDMLEAANKAMMHKLVSGPDRFATFTSGFNAAIDAILTEEKL